MINKQLNYENVLEHSESWTVPMPSGEAATWAGLRSIGTQFGQTSLSTLLIGGVGTRPECRRGGGVRQIFEEAFREAPERGWAVSLLHPFSFSYYRQFGYEKISDQLIVEFPITALAHLPRVSGLTRLTADNASDAVSVYNTFAKGRNLLMARDERYYNPDCHTYIYYCELGQPAGYITVEVDKLLYVNHHEQGVLHVKEYAFTSPEALRALLGFVRVFEGEVERVKLHDCGMCPELDLTLRRYTHTRYTPVPDIMGRILSVEAVLNAIEYPREAGHFSVRVEDSLFFTRGIYEVEYANGKCSIVRREDGAWDISADMPAFTQLVYGYNQSSPQTAAYMQGVKLENSADDFFRAFPKRPCGMFEHF